jgi:hypothetical protein
VASSDAGDVIVESDVETGIEQYYSDPADALHETMSQAGSDHHLARHQDISEYRSIDVVEEEHHAPSDAGWHGITGVSDEYNASLHAQDRNASVYHNKRSELAYTKQSHAQVYHHDHSAASDAQEAIHHLEHSVETQATRKEDWYPAFGDDGTRNDPGYEGTRGFGFGAEQGPDSRAFDSEQWQFHGCEKTSRDAAVSDGVHTNSHFNNDSGAGEHHAGAFSHPIEAAHENPSTTATVPNVSYNTMNIHAHAEQAYAPYYDDHSGYDYPMTSGNFTGPPSHTSEYYAALNIDSSYPPTRAIEFSQAPLDTPQSGFHVTNSEVTDRNIDQGSINRGPEGHYAAERQIVEHDNTGHPVVEHHEHHANENRTIEHQITEHNTTEYHTAEYHISHIAEYHTIEHQISGHQSDHKSNVESAHPHSAASRLPQIEAPKHAHAEQK